MSTSAGVLPSVGGGAGDRLSGAGGGGGGGGGSTLAAGGASLLSQNAVSITAPVVEPPESFGIVAPGVYRCSASSLTQGLPFSFSASNGPRQAGSSNVGSSNNNNNNNNYNNINNLNTTNHNASSSNNGTQAQASSSASSQTSMTPTESFLSSLRLRTILLIVHEKRPEPIASWCAGNNVKLIHLGLGALAEKRMEGDTERDPAASSSLEPFDNLSDTGILSMERIVKDSLEIVLQQSRLPCLMCDTSGVKDVGVIVGCLRRMQRRSFASIRYEYRAFAGSRSRSSHERFIEMFDPDLVSLPSKDKLSPWFAQQQNDDEAEEASMIIR